MVTALRMKQEVKPYIQSCPDAKAGGDSMAVEGAEQCHSAQTVCGGKAAILRLSEDLERWLES